MNRNSLLETAGRSMHQIVRLTLNKANDNPLMQEMSIDGMAKEGRKIVEMFQQFGSSAVPLPRDEQEGGGGGGSADGPNIKGKAAEGIAAFLGGQRNHPVILGVDDRRHRPMGMKPGESFQYDHQGQGTLIRAAATFIMSLDDDGSGSAPGGKLLRGPDGKVLLEKDGTKTKKTEKQERFVSIRHVEKKKQDREKGGTPEKNIQTWIDAGWDYNKASADERAEKASAPNHEDYKHEGDSVNNEMRVTKKRIEFRAGDKVVGYYEGGKWVFIGEVRLGSEDADHPVYGNNNNSGKTSTKSGAGAVLIKAPNPGPPTSLDMQPFAPRDEAIAALEKRIAVLEARLRR
jgi:hypothetical protein